MKPEFTYIDNYGVILKFLKSKHPDAKDYWNNYYYLWLLCFQPILSRYFAYGIKFVGHFVRREL